MVVVFLITFSVRFPWWKPAVNYRHPRILMYHMVNDRALAGPKPNLAVSPKIFAIHLWWLRINGWSFARLSEVIESSPRPKTVVLTFDDGYLDNLTQMLPILRKNNARATVFLIADRARLFAGGLNDGSPLAPMLSDANVRELLSSGLIELGSHTLNHVRLVDLDKTEKTQQIITGKNALIEAFDVPVKTFAYPFGLYDDESLEIVKKAGFIAAVTTQKGISDLGEAPFELSRVKISGGDYLVNFPIQVRIGKKR